MPTNYSGSDTYPASFEIPSDGDPKDAASVNTALEALGDRTKWLEQIHVGFVKVPITSSYDVPTPHGDFVAYHPVDGSGEPTGDAFGLIHDTVGANLVAFPIPVPPRHRLMGVVAAVCGNPAGGAGPHLDVPAVKPRIRVYRADAGGTVTKIQDDTDTAATLVEYDAFHAFGNDGGVAEPNGRASEDATFWVTFRGESGANSISGALLLWDIRAFVEPVPS